MALHFGLNRLYCFNKCAWIKNKLYLLDNDARLCGHVCVNILTITDISCELLLYGSAELGITISQKGFDAVHRFIDETDRL